MRYSSPQKPLPFLFLFTKEKIRSDTALKLFYERDINNNIKIRRAATTVIVCQPTILEDITKPPLY